MKRMFIVFVNFKPYLSGACASRCRVQEVYESFTEPFASLFRVYDDPHARCCVALIPPAEHAVSKDSFSLSHNIVLIHSRVSSALHRLVVGKRMGVKIFLIP